MSADKRTIGVSADSQKILDLIADKTLYRDQVDAAKFAVSLALAKGLEPASGGDLTTKWNVGTFDPSGELRTAVLAYHPDCEGPYRFAEGLLEVGLGLLRSHVEIQGQVDFEVLLEDLKPAVAGGADEGAMEEASEKETENGES